MVSYMVSLKIKWKNGLQKKYCLNVQKTISKSNGKLIRIGFKTYYKITDIKKKLT